MQKRSDVMRLHQNAQRLLRPLLVANPFAKKLSFLDHQTRTRRDHMKYLTMIRAVALLHQYQRSVKSAQAEGREVRYIEVSEQDIEVATKLCAEVLGTSLDQLPPKTRELLGRLDELVTEQAQKHGLEPCDVRFTGRDVREVVQLEDTQLKVHLSRLVEMEYLQYLHLMRDRHSQRFVYALGAGVEGVAESICGYEGKPVGGGRGQSESGVRPVLGSDSKGSDKPAGSVGKPRDAGAINGSSYQKHHISSLVAHGAHAVGQG